MKLRKRIRRLILATPIEGKVIAIINEKLCGFLISKKTAKTLAKLIMSEIREKKQW
jgi:hypothetical protein